MSQLVFKPPLLVPSRLTKSTRARQHTPVRSSRRQRPNKALSLLVFVVIFFISVEGLWRFKAAYGMGPILHSPVKPSPYPEVGFVLEPGAKVYEKNHISKVNSHGLLDKEFPLQKPDDTFRILALGDSITEGFGLPIDKTFPARLEEELNILPMRTKEFHVINAGLTSYNCEQELAYLKYYGLKFNPDLVLVAYYFNDPLPPFKLSGVDPVSNRPYWWFPIKQFLKINSVFAADIMQTIYRFINRSKNIKGPEEEDGLAGYDAQFKQLYDPASSNWARVARTLDGFKTIAEDTGIPIVFVIFPLNVGLDSYRYGQYDKQVEEELKKRNLKFLNLYKSFAVYPEKKLWLHGTDPHLNEMASLVAGKSIATWLSKQKPVPQQHMRGTMMESHDLLSF